MSTAPRPAEPSLPPTPGPERRPAAEGRGMLALPPRGDQLARRWVMVGIALYVLMVFVFLIGLLDAEAGRLQSLTTLVGLGSPRNWSVFFLVVGGFVLT